MLFTSGPSVAVASLLPLFLTSALAQDANKFTYPSSDGGQSFPQGSVLKVEFSTNYQNPYLALFCSNINNPIVLEKAPPPSYSLLLDLAPQPNCYLQIQEGDGPPNSGASFGTGIFSITKSDKGSGNDQQTGSSNGGTASASANAAAVCNCQAVCAANAAAGSTSARRWLMGKM